MECTRRLQFCAGHRVMGHENKCANMHGHNYVVFLTARAKRGMRLDSIGRVIDFSVIKAKVGDWIDEKWDHGFICHAADEVVLSLLGEATQRLELGQKIYVMNDNPTAENMAAELLDRICPMLFTDTDVEIVKVVLWETENCFATVEHR